MTSFSKVALSALFAVSTTLTVALIGAPTAQASAFSEADEAVAYRQQAFQLIRQNFGYMAGMVRGEIDFDGEMFEQRAQALHHLSNIPWDGFKHAGENYSGSGDARAEIWQNHAEFEQLAQQLQEDARKLAEAAASHNLGDVRSAFMATARNCQQCHEQYRD